MTSSTKPNSPAGNSAMVNKGTALMIFLAVFIQGVTSGQTMCRNAVAPPSKPRGVNQVDRNSATPLYELQATPIEITEDGGDKLTAYKIGVSIKSGKPFRFSEATLAVSTNGSCGGGDFDFRLEDYTDIVQEQGEQCPRLLQTRGRTHMTELLPLIWIPPTCGCVTLRMMLVEAGEIFYAENEAVTQGPLAITFCFTPPKPAQLSREHRLDSLCHVIDKHSSGEIMSRGQFRKHRDLEGRWMDRLGLELALELRRADVRTCCRETQYEAKMECFDDARRRRIDEFCADGIPDIPFRTFRRSHMRQMERACCFILGEYRYECFAKNSKMATGSDATTLFDYSMDASDAVNDLADFGSHEHLDSYLKPIRLGGRSYIDDVYGDDDDDDNNGGEEEDEEEEEGDDDVVDEDDLYLEDEEQEDDYESEDDDDDVYAMYPANKRPYQQRPLSRKGDRKDLVGYSPKPTSPTLVRTVSTTVSDRELKRQMRRNKSKLRNSQEKRGGFSSRERKKGRRGGRKTYRRRGSSERRPSAERRASYERRVSSERRASSERRFSAERHGSAERRMSAERRASAERRFNTERRSSSERRTSSEKKRSRSRAMEMPKPRFDHNGGYPRTAPVSGKERGSLSGGEGVKAGAGHGRRVMTRPVDDAGQYGFDDQGTSTVDKTMKKLQRRMQRIKLLKTCCQAGVSMGGQVYGAIGSVKDECGHSADKFVRGISLGGKTRKCVTQFQECCLEEAKKGLTVTSQEFVENTRADYWDTPYGHDYDPSLMSRVLAQRGRRPAPSLDNTDRRSGVPRTPLREFPRPPPQVPSGREPLVQNPLDKTFTEEPPMPQLAESNTRSPIDGYAMSQQRVDNDLRQDNATLDRNPINGNELDQKAVEDFDNKENKLEEDRVVSSEKGENLDDVEIDEKEVDDLSEKSGLELVPSESGDHVGRDDVLDAAKEAIESDGVRTRGQESVERHGPSNSTQATTNVSTNTPTRAPLSTHGGRDQEDLQGGLTPPTHPQDDQGRRVMYKGSIVAALDSREMAARNTQQFMEALDSREMADQYVRRNRKQGKHRKRGRWHRKGHRNYRLTGRRRFRLG